MKNIKENEGITLVALVITIIILLILAGISISSLTKNGLINKSQQAKTENRGAAVQEARDLWKYEQASDEVSDISNTKSLRELIDELVEEKLLTEDEKDKILENEEKGIKAEGQITIGSRTIVFGNEEMTLVDMFKLAEKDGCYGGDSCTNPENHLHVGDYVNYKNPTSGEYVIEEGTYGTIEQKYEITETRNQLNWRVLGIDKETDGLKIITATPMIGSYYFDFDWGNGAVPCSNYIKTLDNISSLYKNEYVAKARSVNLDDICETLGVSEEDIERYNNYGQYAEDINAEYGKEFNIEQQYTPESYLLGKRENISFKNNWVAFYALDIDYLKLDIDSGTEEQIEMFRKNAGISKLNTDTRIMDVLFKGIFTAGTYAYEGTGYPLAYALATVSKIGREGLDGDEVVNGVFYYYNYVIGKDGVAEIGVDGANGNGVFNSSGLPGNVEEGRNPRVGIRPVMILNRNVTKKDIQKIDDQVDELWNKEFLDKYFSY